MNRRHTALALLLTVSSTQLLAVEIIKGQEVPQGTYEEVVRLEGGLVPTCSATVVGRRTILTAAQCQRNEGKVSFSIEGKTYQATITRSPLWDTEDHDVAIGITDSDINVTPAHIGGNANPQEEVTLVGYGCSTTGGGPIDGKKRFGKAIISHHFENNAVIIPSGGSTALLCYGDNGGPTYVTQGGKTRLVAINSQGDMTTKSYSTRTDISKTVDFLKSQAQQKNLEICGIAPADCHGAPPPAPTCSLSANPSVLKIGTTTQLTMSITGSATTASIDGISISPTGGSILKTPESLGTFTALGQVTRAGETSTCEATYVVEESTVPTKPSCTLTAEPSWLKLGSSVTLILETVGDASGAAINGTSVKVPLDQLTLTPSEEGTYTATAVVYGSAGSGSCAATFKVGGAQPPVTPDYAVIPTYCGQNALKETDVAEVCLAKLKKGERAQASLLNEAILVTYRNGTQEATPLLKRAENMSKKTATSITEDLTLYANQSQKIGNYLVLETRDATLVSLNSNGNRVPASLQGRTATGKYYIISQMKPHQP